MIERRERKKTTKQVYSRRVSERVVNIDERKKNMKICKRNPPVHRLIRHKHLYVHTFISFLFFFCMSHRNCQSETMKVSELKTNTSEKKRKNKNKKHTINGNWRFFSLFLEECVKGMERRTRKTKIDFEQTTQSKTIMIIWSEWEKKTENSNKPLRN